MSCGSCSLQLFTRSKQNVGSPDKNTRVQKKLEILLVIEEAQVASRLISRERPMVDLT